MRCVAFLQNVMSSSRRLFARTLATENQRSGTYYHHKRYSVFWSRISDGPIKRSSLSEAALVSEGGKAAKL